MDAVCLCSQRYVGARVDQESCSQFPVLSSQLLDHGYGFSGQRFQVAGGEILFSHLDVLHTCLDGFGNLCEQAAAARGLVCSECLAVGDVVEERARWHLS